MKTGNKTYNKLGLLAASTALSAFMVAADPVKADQTTTNDNDITCPEDTRVKDLTAAQKESCFGEEEEDSNEERFITRLRGRLVEENAEAVIRDLRAFAAIDPEREITFYINSQGGDLVQGLAIHDTMQDIPNDIRTVCEGLAMSAGMTLLSAGTPGKRQALPNCQVMSHQSSGGAIGHIEDTKLRLEFNERLNERSMQLKADYSGWDVDTFTDMMSHNVYLTAEEAKEMGIIDEVLQPTKPPPATANRKTLDDLPDWFCEGERADIARACAPAYRPTP